MSARFFACKISDLADGQMKDFNVDGVGLVLISHVGVKYYATSAICPHFGAPLSKGSISSDGKVICPWHAACFDLGTGDIEDGTSLKPITTYQVEIEGDDLYIRFSEKVVSRPCRPVQSKEEQLVIIGGGAAGISAAISARQNGFGGSVKVISADAYKPYDRVLLTKTLEIDIKQIQLYSEDDLAENNIEISLDSTVVELDTDKKQVILESGKKVTYSKLVLASGGIARNLVVPGSSLNSIFCLRTANDSFKIKEALKEHTSPKVLIIGAGFIGMEFASVLVSSQQAASVTIVSANIPFERQLGNKVGQIFLKLAQSKGVKFVIGPQVASFLPKEDSVGQVVLSDETTLDADLVIVGVGVTSSTGYLPKSMPLEANGTIRVNEFMQVEGFPNIYAAGDIVSYPWSADSSNSHLVHNEHWNIALDQGRIAGNNVAAANLSERKPYKAIPFFWTRQFEKGFNVAGLLNDGYDDVFIKGSPETFKFEAFYHRNGKIIAVAAMDTPPVGAHADLLFRSGKMPSLEYIKAGNSILDIKA